MEGVPHKVCIKCDKKLAIWEFARSLKKGVVLNYCKECGKAYQKDSELTKLRKKNQCLNTRFNDLNFFT